jgi:hypothetical protein
MALPVSAAALVLVFVLSGAAGCGERPPPARAPQILQSPPALRIVAFTDLDGYLEPCGCQSRPLGGIDRAGARLTELDADHVPTLVVAAGNLFFNAVQGRDPEAATQAAWQAETLARGLGQLSLVAAAPGPADVREGPETLLALARLGGFRLLDGRATTPGSDRELLIQRGEVRIGIWGLSVAVSPGAADPAPAEQAARSTAALRARGATLVIGLFAGDSRTARRVAGATAGLDFLIDGSGEQALATPPERVGATTVLRAGHQGQGLLVLDLHGVAASGIFDDVSVWTRDARRAEGERRSAELAERIAAWRRDPGVDRRLLAEQEARLLDMRAAVAQAAAPARPVAKRFDARFLELGPEAPRDPRLRALLDAHDARVNDHNRSALAHVRAAPVPDGMPGYVGSMRCGECHPRAFAWWSSQAHGRAYTTLERVHKEYSLSCVRCHVTGYGRPGGATVVHNEGLMHVGCESCHGPGSLHVEDSDVASGKNVRREVPASVCTACHDPEHSDRFDFSSYRARLIAPGHGLPLDAAP